MEIIGISKDPNSPCIPYQGKVLSITGNTPNYDTVENAKIHGLFPHQNCIHDMGFSEENLDYIQNQNK